MVSIVLVSHSKELSTAVKALADQQIQGRARIAAVGGSDNPHQPFGTDPVAIYEAIQAVYGDDGVLVLMDLGSAVISGRVALDLLEPQQAAHVHLSVGPFVEGAMAAAVQASIGMDLAAVAKEAEEAMHAKRTVLLHEEVAAGGLASAATNLSALPVAVAPPGHPSGDVTVVNPAGLHFGPAARFVQCAARFATPIAVINLTTNAGPADGKRFNQLLSLGVEQHHRIRIAAPGVDADAAVHALVSLVANDVGEVSPLPAASYLPPALEGRGEAILHGVAASPGIAIGVAVVLNDPHDPLRTPALSLSTLGPHEEWQRLEAALAFARRRLDELAGQMRATLGEGQAAIFDAHSLLLQDEDLLTDLRRRIAERATRPQIAVQQSFLQMAQRLHGMAGAVFQQRAADIEDVGRRVLRTLLGETEQTVELPENAIVVAYDLSPSQTATLDRARVHGICTAAGGSTAHTAILARSMGIPAIVGVGELLLATIGDGALLAIDGSRGQIIVAPDASTSAAYAAAQASAAAERQAAWSAACRPTYTRDGLRVEIVANLGSTADGALALEAGAEGVGLLRTEFLFQERSSPPSEDEQTGLYRRIAEQMGNRPLIIRTLDIGGDKPAPYLPLAREANPFLGWRAIRISLNMPEFFKTQLRALLRAAIHGNIHVMFPMVSTIDEVLRAQSLLAAAASELAAAGVPHKATIPTGIMIEVPAAVQIADHLAPLVDFFSIGTNDLTQYTFAADRTNSRVAVLADPLHPAILRQIDAVIRAAHAHGCWCGLCGELAGQPEAIPILLGLGLDEFSMAPASIPAAKELIARLTVPASRRLAQKVLSLADGAAVRAAVGEMLR